MAKIAALVCFGIACVLLISSLAGTSRADLAASPISLSFTAR
ncbi:MAG: hypothetical protein ACKVP3_01400 [Hyphomicrobiaceae bacterium]